MAQARRVAGWVRNTPEGLVEAVFEGDSDAVDELVRFAHEGPRGAKVERVEVAEEEPEGLTGFRVR
jgi:acylphosphatase